MWDSVNLPWDEAKELIKDAQIDPYFKEVLFFFFFFFFFFLQ